MKTELVPASQSASAIELLRAGQIVALPTETVYGLAADALNSDAVARIFEAKDRPRFDPLIVHLPDSWLEKIVNLPAQDRQLVGRLTERFWPGPFTLVLPKKSIVPDIVTAGLTTVAVRMSAHPVFRDIVQGLGRPVAAPSANQFGRISPTTAQHVLSELDGKVPLVVDGGATEHGLESTIVTVCGGKIEILRQGPITPDQLGEFAEVRIAKATKKIVAPGQMESHYAPKTPLRLIDKAASFEPEGNQRVALISWNEAKGGSFVAVRRLSDKGDLREAAANLFRYLRELDALDVDLIVAERVPDQGLGAAIMDRLGRAESAVRGTDHR